MLVLALLYTMTDSCWPPSYTYESSDRAWWLFEMPSKGLDFEDVERNFEDYRRRCGDPDVELRITSRLPWHSPRGMLEVLFHDRWDLESMTPSDPRPTYPWGLE